MSYNYPDGDDFFAYGRDPQSGHDADVRHAEQVDPPEPTDRWVIRITIEDQQVIGIARSDHAPTLEKTTCSVMRDGVAVDIPVERVDVLMGPASNPDATEWAEHRCVACLSRMDEDGCPDCGDTPEFCNWWMISDGRMHFYEESRMFPTAESVAVPGEFEPARILVMCGPMTYNQALRRMKKPRLVARPFPEDLSAEELKLRFPRLLRRMQWVAILSDGEAASALRGYLINRKHKRVISSGGEAVSHYGGPEAVVQAAAGYRGHLMPKRHHLLQPSYWDGWIDYLAAQDELPLF